MTGGPTLNVRARLPKDWLSGAVCPICGNTVLSILPGGDQPDQMKCAMCATTYEIAQDGEHIRLVTYPHTLPPDFGESWEKPGLVREAVYKIQHAVLIQPESPPQEISLANRIAKLSELGNSPKQIREILLSLPGLTAEQVDEAFANPKAVSRRRHDTFLWVTLGVFVIVVAGIITGTLLMTSNQSKVIRAPSNKSFMDPNNLPAPLQTLVQPGMKVLKPTPINVRKVDPNLQPPARCPKTAGEAARLFGGDYLDWTAQNTGWSFISPEPATIKIPANMTAGYLKVDGAPEMVTVFGPVRVENVNFIAVSCE